MRTKAKVAYNDNMKIYVFGNQDVPEDNQAYEYAREIQQNLPQVEFVFIKPNQDLPFAGEKDVVIMDVVAGIEEVRLLTGTDLEKLKLPPRTTVHDFDLGFQLKLLKKLGKIGNVKILGIPMTGKVDHSSIHSMVKKLVAQDMQGS